MLIKALEAYQKGQKCAFATVVESSKAGTPRKIGSKMVVWQDGSLFGTIGGGRIEKQSYEAALKAIKSGRPALLTFSLSGQKDEPVCGGMMKVFIEPGTVQKHLVICGAGHIALPLSVIGKLLNYKVTIIDDRKNLANKKRFSHADKIMVGRHAEELKKIAIDQNTHIMIMTQGHEHDFDCVKTVVKSDHGYLGVISSKPKRLKLFAELKKARVSPKYIKKIATPAGIDIGAQTPEEIAVSIAAELVATNNRSLIGGKKFKGKQ